MEISGHGYWIGYDPKEHRFDADLADSIIEIMKINNYRTIMDVGCGRGQYVQHFTDHNTICYGYDGNPDTVELNGQCKVLDFAIPVNVESVDVVISLEVGEHIPAEFEDVFISNLVSHAEKMLILSWAVLNQGGFGHANCRDNKYIVGKIEAFGFIYNKGYSEFLRLNSALSWFANTIMVFTNDNDNA